MNRAGLILLAGLGSLGLLTAAFGFQHLGGLAPCEMCIWQRYPHGIAFGLSVLGYFAPFAFIILLGSAAALGTGGIGLYHAGVEQGWWEGPSTCSSGDISDLTPDQLMDQILTAPLVQCDQIAWSLAGVSMAGWNAIISLMLAGVWLMALRRA